MGEDRITKNRENCTEQQDLTNGTVNCMSEDLNKAIELFNSGNYIEAIEYCSRILALAENNLTRQYLARCYFRLEKYDSAYRHFSILANSPQDRDYAMSMMATIYAYQNNYASAIKTLKQLPKTTNNIINLAIMHHLTYKSDGGEWLLEEARRLLKSIDLDQIHPDFVCRVHNTYGSIFQSLKEYTLAESHYLKALEFTKDATIKGKILNEYGLLHIEMSQFDKAEQTLDQAYKLIKGNSSLAVGYNAKYRGILSKKMRKFAEAITHLNLAMQIFEEKNLLQETAEVSSMLVELQNPPLNFYEMAEQYANVLYCKTKLKEVNIDEQKGLDHIISSFNNNRDDNNNEDTTNHKRL